MAGKKHAQRITNGQRGAVCGLILVGIPYTHAVKIVGAPYRSMKVLLPTDWTDTKIITRRRWTIDALKELHEAWMDPNQKLATIAARYGISHRMVSYLAHREGWVDGKQRKRERYRKPDRIQRLSPEKRAWYRKMVPVIGRDAALREAWGK
jgi:hypothetical protein